MSRNISFFSLFILLAWLICGCQPQPAVSVSESSLSFSSDGGNKVVTVTANYEWTASSSDSWIRVKTTKDSNELTITVSSSTDTDARQGKVTITCKEVSATINISQSQRDCINLKETALVKLDADAHDVEVKLEANVNFNALVTVGAEWITVKSTKAMTTSTVTLGIAANTTRRTRTGTVTFSATSSDTKQALTIQQLGLAQTLAFVVNGVSTFQQGGEYFNKVHDRVTNAQDPVDAARKLTDTFLLNADAEHNEMTAPYQLTLNEDVAKIEQATTPEAKTAAIRMFAIHYCAAVSSILQNMESAEGSLVELRKKEESGMIQPKSFASTLMGTLMDSFDALLETFEDSTGRLLIDVKAISMKELGLNLFSGQQATVNAIKKDAREMPGENSYQVDIGV